MRARLVRDVDTVLGTFVSGQVVQVLGPYGPSQVEVLALSLAESRIRFALPVSALEPVAEVDE